MDNTFRTILSPEVSGFQIAHGTGVFCMGSCFATQVGQRLDYFKFDSFLNPFGIIYNPISIAKGLEILLTDHLYFDAKDIFEHEGAWHSSQHHSSFSHVDPQQVLEKINDTLKAARTVLQKSECLILTFGSANVFVEEKTGKVVANCHKIPQRNFIKKQLSADEIVMVLDDIVQKLATKFPNLKILLTVSPVRHLREGLVENQLSKAKLLVALHKMAEINKHIAYLPAYEIMMDDLRDYRFYEKDMLHPNEMAVDYIWDFFSKTFFSQKTLDLNERVKQIRMAAAHRPFHEGSSEHLKFKKSQLVKIEMLNRSFPHLNFEEEISFFQ